MKFSLALIVREIREFGKFANIKYTIYVIVKTVVNNEH